MGPKHATPRELPTLHPSELQAFSQQSLFTEQQTSHLYTHFYSISTSLTDDGVIDFQEFSSALSLTDNVQCESLFRLLDANRDGVINFREFLMGAGAFGPGVEQEGRQLLAFARRHEQIELSFRLFDAGNEGKVYTRDMKKLVRASLGTLNIRLADAQIEEIVELTFSSLPSQLDPHGSYIDKEAYKGLIWRNPDSLRWLAVDLDQVAQGARALGQSVRSSKKTKCL